MRHLESVAMLFLVGTTLWLQETPADPGPLPSQPSEAYADGTVADPRNESPSDAHPQPEPVPTPSPSDTDAAALAEVSHRFNELRSALLDHREKTVDWWLTATSVFLTLLSVFAVVAGYFGLKRFREIEVEAHNNVQSSKEHAEKAREHAEKARHLVNEIQVQRDKVVSDFTAETVQKNPDEARKATERTQENPWASEIERAIATAIELQQRESFEESIEKWHALAVVLEGGDKDIAARAWFSVGYLSQEHRRDALDAAIDAYNKAVLLKPDLAEAYSNRGVAKNHLGRHKEAIADHDEAIRLQPDSAEAYNNRGNAKGKLGRHEEAIADLDEAIRLQPDSAEAYNNRGNAKGKLGRHEEAIADLDEAIRLQPHSAEAYNNRGNVKINFGRHEEAIADLDEAIRLQPHFAGAYINRGNAKINLGYHEEAAADLDEAIRLQPHFAGAYINRGMLKNHLGRTEEAIADCQTAVDLARDSGDKVLASAAERVLKAVTDGQTP